MSDGITLCCPRCGTYTALKKEYDEIKVKVENQSLKHPKDLEDWTLPIYTCQNKDCGRRFIIELVVKWKDAGDPILSSMGKDAPSGGNE